MPAKAAPPPGRLRRCLAIVRHYRAKQLALRVVMLWRKQLLSLSGGGRYAVWREPVPALRKTGSLAALTARKLVGRPKPAAERMTANELRQRTFCFLGQELTLPTPMNWRLNGATKVSHLWRFHFHYHEFLLDVLAAGEEVEKDTQAKLIWDFVSGWIEGNSLSDPATYDDAWHPFCISRRLPVWVALWQTVPPPDGEVAARVLSSMVQQADFLCSHLEWDVGGNHLLENLRALAVAGAFVDGAASDRWLKKVARLLPVQLDAQILPHGEHFECSPMYHAAMLDAILDVRDAFEDIDPEVSSRCRATAVRMATFLQRILHPDGEFPHFADSASYEAPPAQMLIAASSPDAAALQAREFETQTSVAPPDPYWTWRDRTDFVIFDTGQVGADFLPAHAHCDLLSVEASIAGRRFLVDSGVYSYEDNAMRQYCRSTAAHNALEVDGRNQCDIWSRFRMGFRGRATGLVTGSENGFQWSRATHNGYRRQGVPTVGRWIACRKGGPWIIVDWASGAGDHKLTNRLHLHPDVQVLQSDSGAVLTEIAGEVVWIHALGSGTMAVKDGWYCPEFGQRIANPVVTWTSDDSLPAVCGWMLTRNGDHQTPCLAWAAAGFISVEWEDSSGLCKWEIPTCGA